MEENDYQLTLPSEWIDITYDSNNGPYKDKDTSSSDVTIFYKVYIDARSWGIKDVSPHVIKCEGSVFLLDADNYDNETEIEIDDTWEVEEQAPEDFKNGISPTFMEIDIDSKKISVVF
tara:strand:+ start:7303 stop:7656 length:354 start_codon:yes stop_codon:yes gene_type:complete